MKRLVVVGPRSLAGLARRAVSSHFDVLEAANLGEARTLLAPASTRVLLMFHGWAGAHWNDDAATSGDIPGQTAVIVVIPEFDSRLWMHFLRRGAVDVLSEPLDHRQLHAALRSACRAAERTLILGKGTRRYGGVLGWLLDSWQAIRQFRRLPLSNRSFRNFKG